MRKVVQLLIRFYSQKVWTRDDVERAHRTGPKSGDINRPRPLIARLHRWNDKISVLQERDGRKAMSDTLNIRVATDLTDRQNNILREEKSAGRQACFYNGRLCYRERRSPRRSLRSSSKTGSRPHRASHDAPPYPSARNNRCLAGTEHYKTKPLPYSPTWKSSRCCTDRRQGTEPTADPIHRELRRLKRLTNDQYR